MTADPWPDHLLSLDEWAALPEDNAHHFELIEGELHVSPRPVFDHQRAQGKLFRQLDTQLPTDLVALLDAEIVIRPGWPATVRAPDLIVVPSAIADTNPARCPAEDVLLAIEVISPGSRERDRVHKPFEYGRAGIPNYWIVDLDGPVTMTAYELVGADYKIVGKSSGTIALTEPAPVTVDVAGLLPHRA
jgi:Uma2 family endonuclease